MGRHELDVVPMVGASRPVMGPAPARRRRVMGYQGKDGTGARAARQSCPSHPSHHVKHVLSNVRSEYVHLLLSLDCSSINGFT